MGTGLAWNLIGRQQRSARYTLNLTPHLPALVQTTEREWGEKEIKTKRARARERERERERERDRDRETERRGGGGGEEREREQNKAKERKNKIKGRHRERGTWFIMKVIDQYKKRSWAVGGRGGGGGGGIHTGRSEHS